jgi:uncharacterized protein (DUF1499 family)
MSGFRLSAPLKVCRQRRWGTRTAEGRGWRLPLLSFRIYAQKGAAEAGARPDTRAAAVDLTPQGKVIASGQNKMRRLIVEERTSVAAVLSWRLSLFATAVAGVGILAARQGLEPPAVVAVLASAAVLAVVAILCALVAFAVIWYSGDKGALRAFAGLIFSLMLLAYPAFVAAKAYHLPALPDISTDLIDPPAFSLSRQALAARDGTTPETAPTAMRASQARHYPKILPILVDLDGADAYAAVVKAVTAAGWRIVEKKPPGGRLGHGHIEAVAGSRALNFPYDISIRLRPLAGQTRIDLRSVARFSTYDFGENPRNIEVFEAALEAEVIPAEK